MNKLKWELEKDCHWATFGFAVSLLEQVKVHFIFLGYSLTLKGKR